MKFHRPGRPEDLPPVEMLWSHGAALAALGAGIRDEWAIFAVEDEVLHFDDGGGNEWSLVRIEGGRAVLVGHDHECSDTYDFHPTPIDFLAGGPDWLPWEWLADYEDREPVGFLYWWDGAVWSRVPYPDGVDDDGLGMLVERISSIERAVDEVREFLDHAYLEEADAEDGEDEEFDEDAALSRGRELMRRAAEGTVDSQALAVVLELIDGERPGVPAALEVARRAGLTAGAERPHLPAGRGRPAERRVRKISGTEWGLRVGEAMRAARELDRPTPQDSEELRALVDAVRGCAVAADGVATLTATVTGRGSSMGVQDASGRMVDAGFDMFRLLDRLRGAEAHPERGRWFYLRVAVTPEGEVVERAYDHWPWWEPADNRFNATAPVGCLREEMARRAPEWCPEWTPLLDEEVLYSPPRLEGA
ncbi:hypothetical protein HNR23_003920 [Nocardiopsis mwathae]|uniref:Uncharacterized protein n=1 Tax=Nocardiopsis mwathae TaxID=1472723 RepID=A0A7W9YKI4_9ACTN|nr:hypothetical protein [Nocardiopsis mwathae]MBB6173860.1 hypothetical protein [Nocardiopsis mwathae]